MFVLPIIAGTFSMMSVLLTLPLLSLLSFQSISTIDWCSFPTIAAYLGDIIDIGMNVAPRVTCCAVTSAGFFVLALLAFLCYHVVHIGSGSYQFPAVEAQVRSPTPLLSSPATPQTVVSTASQEDTSLADITLVEDLSSQFFRDPSLPKIVTLKADLPEYNIPLHAFSPSNGMIDIPMDATDDDHALLNTNFDASTHLATCVGQANNSLPSHGSITTNLVDISSDLQYEDTDGGNPWLASPKLELDSEFTVQLQQLITSIAAMEIYSTAVNVSTKAAPILTATALTSATTRLTGSVESGVKWRSSFQRLKREPVEQMVCVPCTPSKHDNGTLLKRDGFDPDEIRMLAAECNLTNMFIDSDNERTWKRARRGGKRTNRSLTAVRANMEAAEALAISMRSEPSSRSMFGEDVPSMFDSSFSAIKYGSSDNNRATVGLAITGAPDDGSVAVPGSFRLRRASGDTRGNLVTVQEAAQQPMNVSALSVISSPEDLLPVHPQARISELTQGPWATQHLKNTRCEGSCSQTSSLRVERHAVGGPGLDIPVELRSTIPQRVATFVARRNSQTTHTVGPIFNEPVHRNTQGRVFSTEETAMMSCSATNEGRIRHSLLDSTTKLAHGAAASLGYPSPVRTSLTSATPRIIRRSRFGP